jgi:hypothetical protein
LFSGDRTDFDGTHDGGIDDGDESAPAACGVRRVLSTRRPTGA